uniref:Uncharacterized protein n=1 Tax=Malurus cyaneus samueli TaxID=2593467 RepID=A0A8C5UN89_9PASS
MTARESSRELAAPEAEVYIRTFKEQMHLELELPKISGNRPTSPKISPRSSPRNSPCFFRKLLVNKSIRQRRRFTVAHTWPQPPLDPQAPAPRPGTRSAPTSGHSQRSGSRSSNRSDSDYDLSPKTMSRNSSLPTSSPIPSFKYSHFLQNSAEELSKPYSGITEKLCCIYIYNSAVPHPVLCGGLFPRTDWKMS